LNMTSRSPSKRSALLVGRRVVGPVSARIQLDGREYLNFLGSGYLALSKLPELRSAARAALEAGVPFAQQVPAVFGVADPPFDAVERAAARACASEGAVYFASGYLLGCVGLASLGKPPDVVFLDEDAHYNLADAATQVGCRRVNFAHCNSEALREALRREVRAGERPVVLTDGVFATTGELAPLADYVRELAPYGGRLFVDEAHSFGVVGDNGRGAIEYFGVEGHADMGATLSKAICAQGAFVACTREAASRLRSVPAVLGAGAGSPISALVAAASLDYVAAHPHLRSELFELTRCLRLGLRRIGIEVIDSPAPIVAFGCGNREEMLTIQERLFANGILIHHSNYVGAGQNGLIRCAVFRDHTREDLERLISELGELSK
jgi:7-keto-8-aminopelargonate synthetase-like enzyme